MTTFKYSLAGNVCCLVFLVVLSITGCRQEGEGNGAESRDPANPKGRWGEAHDPSIIILGPAESPLPVAKQVELLTPDVTKIAVHGASDSDVSNIVARCPHLIFYQHYSLESELTDKGMQEIEKLVHLNSLYIRGASIGKAAFRGFTEFKVLKRLTLDKVRGITTTHVARIGDAVSLEYLSIRRSDDLSDKHLKQMAEFQQLASIELLSCGNVTPEGVKLLRKALPACKIVVREWKPGD